MTDEPFTCKYCHNPEPHDRRGCSGTQRLKRMHANPDWSARMKKRNSEWLRAKWAKVKQAEKDNRE